MTNERRVDRRIRSSARHRLNLLEEIAMGIVSYDVNETTVVVDTGDTDWFEDPLSRRDMANLRMNDADITWARLTAGGGNDHIDLDAGRYKISFQLLVQNTHATLGMNFRFALVDDAATPLYVCGVLEAGTSEPALAPALDNNQIYISHTDFIEVTDPTNVLYFCTALAVTSQTGGQITGGNSKILIERLG